MIWASVQRPMRPNPLMPSVIVMENPFVRSRPVHAAIAKGGTPAKVESKIFPHVSVTVSGNIGGLR